jgi:hypothetical protein
MTGRITMGENFRVGSAVEQKKTRSTSATSKRKAFEFAPFCVFVFRRRQMLFFLFLIRSINTFRLELGYAMSYYVWNLCRARRAGSFLSRFYFILLVYTAHVSVRLVSSSITCTIFFHFESPLWLQALYSLADVKRTSEVGKLFSVPWSITWLDESLETMRLMFLFLFFCSFNYDNSNAVDKMLWVSLHFVISFKPKT